MESELNQSGNRELELLLGQKGKTCVSILAPTNKQFADANTDNMLAAQAVQRAVDLLKLGHPQEADPLSEALRELVQTIDSHHTQEGLGLFVSDAVRLVVHFPFPVAPRVVIDKRFKIKDVLYKVLYSFPYYVLMLEEERAFLFRGILQHLEEIHDQNFPHSAVSDYEYRHPSPGVYASHAHLKAFQDDNQERQKIRYRSFLSRIDDLLGDYLTEGVVLLICGAKKHTSAFLNLSQHDARIISVITLNEPQPDPRILAELVTPSINAFLEEKMKDEISLLKENMGEGLAEEGYEPVKQAVEDSRGIRLLLEKDYEYHDLLHDKNGQIVKPADNHTIDAVEELIENMLAKKGQVLLLEKGMLQEHRHIALITSY